MAMIRAVLHSGDALDDPAALLRRLNDHFRYLWPTAMFATCIAAVLDGNGRANAARRQRRLCTGPSSGGRGRARERGRQRAAALLRCIWVSIECLIRSAGRRRIGSSSLHGRRSMERHAGDDSIYDLPRLLDVLSRQGHGGVAAMLEHLVHDLDTFGGETEPDDDQTALAVGIRIIDVTSPSTIVSARLPPAQCGLYRCTIAARGCRALVAFGARQNGG